MPMPKVTTNVIDLSTRVSSVGTYNAAIVVAAPKGPIDTPVLVTSQTAFLQKFTPNERLELGFDTAMYEAFKYLASQSNLYVVRASNGALYGGCKIRTFKADTNSEAFENGVATVAELETMLDNEQDVALYIYGADQGAYNNDISVAIVTDPELVKLDQAFLVLVYKKGVKVEEHVCSLNPSLKNGYQVNCYVEEVLKTSKYIRALACSDLDEIKDSSYEVNVKGTVNFENKTIATTEGARINREYHAGEVARVKEIDGQIAYYVVKTAGKTASTTPTWVNEDAYLELVEDGTVIWELAEIVVPYEPAMEVKKGTIVSVTANSKTLYYRAKTSGTTALVSPEWTDKDGIANYVVEDNDIVWTNQTQSKQVTEQKYYTYAANVKDALFNTSLYGVYSDLYLGKKIKLAETLTVENPTTADPIMVEMPVEYAGVYTGEKSPEHYSLPKASEKVNGAYVLTQLGGGNDGLGVLDGQRIKALKTLANPTQVDVQLIMDGGNTTAAYHTAIGEVCEAREHSCHGIISVPYECTQGMITGDPFVDTNNYRKVTLNANTSSLELYHTHQLMYDEFNDRYLYTSPSCYVAAAIMKVAQAQGWHWAVAGVNRGVINSNGVSRSYAESEIDVFSDNQINTIINDPGYGFVIMDELNQLAQPCDMQECHIARYVNIRLRPSLKNALKPFIFEFNDEETRMRVVKMVDTFMIPEMAARAVYDYRVVCDDTNNSDNDIQNNIMNCWLYIKPTKIAKWIRQSIIITPYSTSFEDVQF